MKIFILIFSFAVIVGTVELFMSKNDKNKENKPWYDSEIENKEEDE